jgi:hypothetical protein
MKRKRAGLGVATTTRKRAARRATIGGRCRYGNGARFDIIGLWTDMVVHDFDMVMDVGGNEWGGNYLLL